jgi:hypothetical protein
MRNCASGNLELPGSMLRIAPGMTRRFFELIVWGGSVALPPFRLPGAFLILAGIARLRQNLTAKLVMPGLVPGIHVLPAP